MPLDIIFGNIPLNQDDIMAAKLLGDAVMNKIRLDVGGQTGVGLDLLGRQRVDRIVFNTIRRLTYCYLAAEKMLP